MRRRLIGGDRGHVDRVRDRAGEQVVRHLFGDLQGDVFLRFGGGRAEVGRARRLCRSRTADFPSRARSRTRRARRRRRGRWPSASFSAFSSIRPPRAQLMMRTPFFVLASDLASRMLRVLSVSGVCSVMKSARCKQFVEFDLVDAEVGGAFGAEIRVEGGDLHAQALRAFGDDRADVAAADDAQASCR